LLEQQEQLAAAASTFHEQHIGTSFPIPDCKWSYLTGPAHDGYGRNRLSRGFAGGIRSPVGHVYLRSYHRGISQALHGRHLVSNMIRPPRCQIQ
jgi:hypothetical protein